MPPLPPPLPPAERTVGQLVAEAIRLYGRRFWATVALGVGPAAFVAGAVGLEGYVRALFVLVAGPVLLSATYALAVAVAADVERARLPVAIAVGVPAFFPFALSRVFVFAGAYLLAFAWFALLGLAVPSVLIERRGALDAVRRGVALARADFVHALGSVAALAIVIVVCLFMLFFLLAGFGDQAAPAAALIAVLVLGPLFFLGAALLYFDQAARADAPR